MKTVFYLFAILPIIQEIMVLNEPKKWHNFAKRIKGIQKGHPDYENKMILGIFTMFYMVWAFIGLFSFQWWAFALLFIISFIPKKWVWYRWLDALISVIILFFVVLNNFHFHINLL